MIKLKYISGILLLLGFVVSYLLRNYVLPTIKEKELYDAFRLAIDYTYSLSNCLGISLIFYYFGRLEKNNKVKWLFDYTISIFFIAMFFAYILNLSFDILIGVNKVFFSFIITVIPCLIGLFVKF